MAVLHVGSVQQEQAHLQAPPPAPRALQVITVMKELVRARHVQQESTATQARVHVSHALQENTPPEPPPSALIVLQVHIVSGDGSYAKVVLQAFLHLKEPRSAENAPRGHTLMR